MGYEITDHGYLAKILVKEGSQDIDVNTVIAVLAEEKESVGVFKDYKVGTI